MIKVNDITKSYKNGEVIHKILKGITIEFKDGEFNIIYGASGSGKTTFLNILGMLETSDSGNVFYDDICVTTAKKNQVTDIRQKYVGFIFQSYNLFQNLTVEENVMMGAHLADNMAEVDNVLKSVDLIEHKNKFPYQLSGGQQQRVAIARALAKRPSILFCDEPTGALDSEMSFQILELLQKLQREEKITIIMVTHNPDIKEIADKIIYLRDGQIKSVVLNENPSDVSYVRGIQNEFIN